MANRAERLILNIDAGSETDAEHLEELTRQLRRELLELDLEDVQLAQVQMASVRAKAGDPFAWGTLLLTLAASGGVLTALINTLQSWVSRHDRRGVTLEIGGDKLEVAGISSEEQRRLIDAWVGRHAKR